MERARERWPGLWAFVKLPKTTISLASQTQREETGFLSLPNIKNIFVTLIHSCKVKPNIWLHGSVNVFAPFWQWLWIHWGAQKTTHQSSAAGDSKLPAGISHFYLLDIKDWSTISEEWDLSQDCEKNVSKLRGVIWICYSYAPLPLMWTVHAMALCVKHPASLFTTSWEIPLMHQQ